VLFDVITIFPEFFSSILDHGVLKRGRAGGQIEIRIHDLRDATDDRHHTVDDRPFGGGPGMVFKPEPVFRAIENLKEAAPDEPFRVVLLTPQGRLLTQSVAEELSREKHLALICARYEGVDERVAAHLATDEISIGDYVLAGGELAAAVVMETVTRLLPGVLGNEESAGQDSFAGFDNLRASEVQGILDCPHYTRPPQWRGWTVPEVLLSGNHEEIRRWRRRQALEKTWRKRPELLERATLSKEDREMLEEIRNAASETHSR
jgi:tRNA (guanine37-N1)-methyltransferase